jgi:16S rRNA (cytosine967-C5)-methyltransferase
MSSTLELPSESRRGLSPADRRLIARALSALLRWWGWIETAGLRTIEEQLLLAWVLDANQVAPICRPWAYKAGRDPDAMTAVGDAPNWTLRAEGFKRWAGERSVNADPWRLFPSWVRDEVPVPPGEASSKLRRLELLYQLQCPSPLWVGVRGQEPKIVWNELRDQGLKPWIHRRLPSAGRLPMETELAGLAPFQAGVLVVEDLASQVIGPIVEPDPGERWWDVFGGSSSHALHLADEMRGKGLVVSTYENETHRRSAVLRLRRGPFRNITTRLWDGRHPTGKAGGFDGVLLDAPGSAIGTWRRHPDARWTVVSDDLARLAAHQLQLLELVATRVKPGGFLLYTTPTLTTRETTGVVEEFLEAHPEFRLAPFPDPLEEESTNGMLTVWPQQYDSEGRFIARLMRTTSSASRTVGDGS